MGLQRVRHGLSTRQQQKGSIWQSGCICLYLQTNKKKLSLALMKDDSCLYSPVLEALLLKAIIPIIIYITIIKLQLFYIL